MQKPRRFWQSEILFVTIIQMKKFLTLFIICAALAFGFVEIARAQTGSLLPADVNLTLSPETPGANQQVSAAIDSYSTDLDAATVYWLVNEKTIQSGKGVKTFSFVTGPTNTTTTLSVFVITQTGQKILKTFTIKPSNVDLIWEAYGYTPPFYKGKTLFSHQDEIRFIALPHIIGGSGAEIPAGNLIYKWTRNGTVLGDFSGYGKNTYTMIASVISRPLEIDVEVTSPTSDDLARSLVTVNPVEPIIIFYENNPLYGIEFQKALTGTVALSNSKEINVLAEPFFFDESSFASGFLSYNWSINGSQIDTDTTQTSRVFRPKEGTAGTSNISVSIGNTNKMLQSADSSFDLQFNNATKQNAF